MHAIHFHLGDTRVTGGVSAFSASRPAAMNLFLICLSAASLADGFAPQSPRRSLRALGRPVAPINVETLDDEVTSKLIEVELIEMLDREWIEQECHRVLGRRARESFLRARAQGLDDIGGILQHVGEELTSDTEGFDEAFVGPWDVANFISDVLMARTSGDDDRCACSASPSAADLEERARTLGV